jgi:flagellar hook-length control protein FliK
MLTTLRGTVELDPMRVPVAASMSTGRDGSFEDVLQQAVEAAPESDAAAETAATPAEEAPAEETPVEDQAAEDQGPRETPAEATPELDEAGTVATHMATAEPDVTETTRRGEPVRQETAGKGADSPRTSSPRGNETLIAAFVVHGATAGSQTPVAGVAANAAVGAVGAAKATGEGPARGIDGPAQRFSTPVAAAAVAGGYRTNSVASAQLLEQARDSVFKQILMKLAPDGGEMHLRLDPPELGEVDLHMVVEKGNQISLSIATERQDLTQLLQRHLDELKQSLRDVGLEVTDAQVRTRDGGERGQRHDGSGAQHGGADDRRDPSNPPTRRGGYVTAEGLDFWV